MVSGREKFGAFIRREREAKEIGLREMAKMIGISPTYLSKVERDEFRGQGREDRQDYWL
jgi:transcriptional regulator with XRE-family HTH domain